MVDIDVWLISNTGLSTTPFILLCFFVALSALIRGLIGFGFAILAVPLISLVTSPVTAVILALLAQLVIAPFGVREALDIIDKAVVAKICVLAGITTPLGLWLIDIIHPKTASILLSLVAIGSFAVFVIKRPPESNHSKAYIVATGFAAGLLNGFAAMPGPPVVLYFVRKNISPAVSRASMITVFLTTAIIGTTVAVYRGMIDLQILILAVLICPILIIGNFVGTKFFGTVSEATWRSFVILLLSIAALAAIWKAF